MAQVLETRECHRASVATVDRATVDVRPGRRNEYARAVRQNQDEMQRTSTMGATQDLQGMSIERMARTSNRHPLGARVVVRVVVGIVSCLPSTPWIMGT